MPHVGIVRQRAPPRRQLHPPRRRRDRRPARPRRAPRRPQPRRRLRPRKPRLQARLQHGAAQRARAPPRRPPPGPPLPQQRSPTPPPPLPALRRPSHATMPAMRRKIDSAGAATCIRAICAHSTWTPPISSRPSFVVLVAVECKVAPIWTRVRRTPTDVAAATTTTECAPAIMMTKISPRPRCVVLVREGLRHRARARANPPVPQTRSRPAPLQTCPSSSLGMYSHWRTTMTS
mmetsp:Transcript_37159/g.107283  ORF Transcript_37159/g.107283 Transcript_37159/m.107283 type:complete len:233 (+) Transcript_37159:482-1180(+)